MQTILDQLIADFQERSLPSLTPRQARLPRLPGKIDTVIGMRRSGKTWFLYHNMHRLISQGIPRECLLYLNFEDERLLPMTTGDLQQIPEVFYRRFPHLKNETCYYFFDEIQNVPGWELFLRRLLDTENAHFCITGSSAKLLSAEIATSLRGRSLAAEIFPFSFAEALAHAGAAQKDTKIPGAKRRALLKNFVFLELRRQTDRIEYYRTQKGREVDFYLTDAEGTPRLIQVAAEITGGNTRRREVTALTEAMAECRLAQSTIVTFDIEDTVKTEAGRIHVTPAWKWALNIGSH